MRVLTRSVGFIGLGNMGIPMSRRLIDAGCAVTGFDLNPAARDAFAVAGGRAVESAVAVLEGADVVILMLPNSAIVNSVVNDAAFLAAIAMNTLVVDMSSSEPLLTRDLAATLRERGIHLVDAPVSGGVKGAGAGTLTIMAGGSDDDIATASVVLDVLGRVNHVGPVGAGHALKALNNLMSATHLWVTSEAMIAGMRFGLDPTVMLAAVNGSSGRSGSTENKWPNFVVPETYNSGFGLQLMLKDMRIALGLSQQLGVESVLGQQAVALWAQAAEELPSGADHTEVARWLAERAGTAHSDSLAEVHS
jgi:3-hydroxyisobutyrate dehydrogenase